MLAKKIICESKHVDRNTHLIRADHKPQQKNLSNPIPPEEIEPLLKISPNKTLLSGVSLINYSRT